MSSQVIQLPLGADSYKARSPLVTQRLYNCYPETNSSSSTINNPVIYGIPGQKLWLDLGIFNDIYGFTTMNNYLYVVCGLSVFKIDINKQKTKIGELGTRPNSVMMTENGLQVTILTDSGEAYYYQESDGTFAQITDSNYFNSSSLCTIDGYTIYSKQDSGLFFLSNNSNTQTFSALDYAEAQALSDNIIRVIAFNRDLYIFGSRSIEIWQSTGVGTPPFQRINGVFTQQGAIARDAIVSDINGVFFLGNDNIVYMMAGYQPQRISTFGIEYEISKATDTSNARAFIYTQAGHKFYCLTIPDINKTFCYDISLSTSINQNTWHERGSFDLAGAKQGKWSCQFAVNFNNLTLVNNNNAGKIYYLDLDSKDENGQEIKTEIITPLIADSYRSITINALHLVVDSGVGITEPDQGSDPQMMLEVSKDGGNTFQAFRYVSIGKIGAYKRKVTWSNIGTAREFIFKFSITDPVQRSFVGCFLQATQGDI